MDFFYLIIHINIALFNFIVVENLVSFRIEFFSKDRLWAQTISIYVLDIYFLICFH